MYQGMDTILIEVDEFCQTLTDPRLNLSDERLVSRRFATNFELLSFRFVVTNTNDSSKNGTEGCCESLYGAFG